MVLSNKDAMPKKNNSLIPWIVLTVCVLPVIASTALYHLWEPDGFVNNGELIEPVPLSDLVVPSIEGTTKSDNGTGSINSPLLTNPSGSHKW